MNINNKGFVTLLLMAFLCFFVLSTLAVPSSRSLIINPPKKDLSTEFLHTQEVGSMEEEKRKEGRIVIELTDYPGAGANPGHDPSVPGGTG